jgi:hypothetical protein
MNMKAPGNSEPSSGDEHRSTGNEQKSIQRINWIERFTLVFAAVAAFGSVSAALVSCWQYNWVFATDRAYLLAQFSGYSGRQPVPNIEASFWFRNYGKTPGRISRRDD